MVRIELYELVVALRCIHCDAKLCSWTLIEYCRQRGQSVAYIGSAIAAAIAAAFAACTCTLAAVKRFRLPQRDHGVVPVMEFLIECEHLQAHVKAPRLRACDGGKAAPLGRGLVTLK
eukprot:scaffold1139_cov62-Phaeocystis_antarctica.AAC.5